jgi:nucleotide-binding universal stress UspA family protein
MIRTIAVGTDGSETAGRAVAFAVDMAARYEAGLVVASSYTPVREDRLQKDQQDAPRDVKWAINPMQQVEPALRDAEDAARERGVPITTDARMGDPAETLCQVAEEYEADVLVVGSKGMRRRVLGSVPNTVSHRAPCSVVVVKTV